MRVFQFIEADWQLLDPDGHDYFIEYSAAMHGEGSTEHLLVFTATDVEDIYVDPPEDPEETNLTYIKENVLPSYQVSDEGLVRILSDVPYAGYVSIYGPPVTPPVYVSHFNTSDGSTNAIVSNVATQSRYVAAPTTESDPYSVGAWDLSVPRSCLTNGTLVYSTPEAFSLVDMSTTSMYVEVLGATGELLAELTRIVDANVVETQNNITLTIADLNTNSDKARARVTVSIDLAAILPLGGRFSARITHHNGAEGDFTKLQADVFYDTNPQTTHIQGPVTVAENTPVNTKFVSGVEYYTLGSAFEADVTDVDFINANSRPANSVQLTSNFGLATLNIPAPSMAGWVGIHTNVGASYNNPSWTITETNLFLQTTTAHISAQALDSWTVGNTVASSNMSLLVNTKDTVSTNTIERFFEESYRCPLTANFDAASQRSWNSIVDLGPQDACFYNGGLERRTDNFQLYKPNPIDQPDYSTSQDTEVLLIREFISDGQASSNARIYINGTVTTLEIKLAKAWDGTASGGTEWMDCLVDYNPSLFNNGAPSDGSGCRTNAGSGFIDITFGSQNVINTGNTAYLKVGLTGAQRVTGPLSVVFS